MFENEIKATAIFVDIRNFTSNLNKYFNTEKYFLLLEKVYQSGIRLSYDLNLQDSFYINSTGDGYLIVISSEESYLDGYIYALLLHLILQKHFLDFFKKPLKVGDYYFGIGLEYGSVRKISANYKSIQIETYLGNAINIASRLETLTKDHARAPIIFGAQLNEALLLRLENVSYLKIMDQAKKAKSTEKAQLLHQQMANYNSLLLSSYLFEHRLKGLESPMPTFRISPTLFDVNKYHFWELIERLSDNRKKTVISCLKKIGIVKKIEL